MADFVKNGVLYAPMVLGPNEDYAIVFDVDSTLKLVADPFRAGQAVAATFDTTGNTSFTGTVTATGGFVGSTTRLGQVNLAVATPKVLTAAESGQTFVGVVDCAFTLPLASAAGAGAHYIIITGVASAGAGVTVTRAGADTIDGRVSPTGVTITNATVLTNTPATDIKGDLVWLVGDGVSKWEMIGILGVWA